MNEKEKWANKVRSVLEGKWITLTTHSSLLAAREALWQAQRKWPEAEIVKLVRQ